MTKAQAEGSTPTVRRSVAAEVFLVTVVIVLGILEVFSRIWLRIATSSGRRGDGAVQRSPHERVSRARGRMSEYGSTMLAGILADHLLEREALLRMK